MDVPLNEYELSHEQLHFDITELFRRKFNTLVTDNAENEEKVSEIYRQIAKDCERYQNLYDAETDHSRNIKKQNEWITVVENALLSLQEFENVKIPLKKPHCKLCWSLF